MKFVVLINRHAGTVIAEKLSAEEITTVFSAHGVVADVRLLDPEQISDTLPATLAERPDAIVVGGGDGTIRSAAGLLVETSIPLGVLPLGTLNHFAKDLGLPASWRDAVAALARGETRSVDVAEVNGHVFVNNCSLGTYAEAIRRRDALRREHGQGKWLAMARASLQVLRELRRLRLTITLDGTTRTVRTPLAAVANNRYTGHVLETSKRANLAGGELWLYTAHVHRFLSALRLMWQILLRRRPDDADALASHAARVITIECAPDSPVPVAADGESIDVTPPLHFRLRARALRVLVPPGASPGA